MSRAGPRTADPDDANHLPEPPGATAGQIVGPIVPWVFSAIAGSWAGAMIGWSSAGQLGEAVVSGRLGTVRIGLVLVVALGGVVGLAIVSRTRGAVRGAALAGFVVVVTVLLAGLRTATSDLGALPALAERGGAAEVRFTVVAEPRPITTGWHVPVEVTDVDGVATRERAAVTLRGERLDRPPLAGAPPALDTRWSTTATARPLPDGGYGRWLARQHLTALLDVGPLHPDGRPGWLASSSEHIRQRTREAAARHTSPPVGGLLVGLVTGDTRALPGRDRDAMEATAMTHLTAVSGMHLASVIAGVLGLCELVRLEARTRRVLVGVVVLWFAYLTRFQPSVLRAGCVAGVVLLAASRGVLRDGRHALAGAVLVLVLVDPLLAGALGLLLSATAAAGVLVAAPRIRDRLRTVRLLPRRVADVLAVTVGAQVAVVPILLVSFTEVPLASVPANLVAVPLAVVAAAIAFPATVVAAVHLPAGAVLFAVAAVPARGILGVAHATAGWGGVASVAAPSTVVALLAAAAWAVSRPRSRSSRWLAGATAVACVVAAVPPVAGRLLPVDTFTVTAIDVGQGDAFLLRAPGARVLVDAGSDATAARWLARHGQVSLDLLVITHGHDDHLGGADDILTRADVGAIWRPPNPEPVAGVARLDAAAAEAGVPVRVVRAAATGSAPVSVTIGALRLEVLGPPSGDAYRYASSPRNETSLVVRASSGDRVALLAGDVEAEAQRDLLTRSDAAVAAGKVDPLRAGLLAVPHHGAGTTSPAFLARVDAEVGLVSVGAQNTYGHPDAGTLAALDAAGTRVHRTDLEGTVTVEVPAPRSEPGRARRRASVACRHEPRPPPRRRRRPAAPTGARAGARPAPRAGRRPHRRGPRRRRDRPPAGAPHRLAVRGADLRGAPRGRGRLG